MTFICSKFTQKALISRAVNRSAINSVLGPVSVPREPLKGDNFGADIISTSAPDSKGYKVFDTHFITPSVLVFTFWI